MSLLPFSPVADLVGTIILLFISLTVTFIEPFTILLTLTIIFVGPFTSPFNEVPSLELLTYIESTLYPVGILGIKLPFSTVPLLTSLVIVGINILFPSFTVTW